MKVRSLCKAKAMAETMTPPPDSLFYGGKAGILQVASGRGENRLAR
jgi:hypothetical protein